MSEPAYSNATRTGEEFSEAVGVLLLKRRLSQRRLAKRIGVDPAHLSRVLRKVEGKRASADLATKVAVALSLPPHYFVESRLGAINERVRADPALRERLFEALGPIAESEQA